MREEDRSPGDEDEKEEKLSDQVSIRLIQDPFKNFLLPLAHPLGLPEERKGRKSLLGRDPGGADFLIPLEASGR